MVYVKPLGRHPTERSTTMGAQAELVNTDGTETNHYPMPGQLLLRFEHAERPGHFAEISVTPAGYNSGGGMPWQRSDGTQGVATYWDLLACLLDTRINALIETGWHIVTDNRGRTDDGVVADIERDGRRHSELRADALHRLSLLPEWNLGALLLTEARELVERALTCDGRLPQYEGTTATWRFGTVNHDVASSAGVAALTGERVLVGTPTTPSLMDEVVFYSWRTGFQTGAPATWVDIDGDTVPGRAREILAAEVGQPIDVQTRDGWWTTLIKSGGGWSYEISRLADEILADGGTEDEFTTALGMHEHATLTADGGHVASAGGSIARCVCGKTTGTVRYELWTAEGRTGHGTLCASCRRSTEHHKH